MKSFLKDQSQIEGTPVPLSPQEAFVCLEDGAAILDIRPEYETNYRVFDVPHIYSLPFSAYREKFHEVPRETPLVVSDNVGLWSPEVAQFLLDNGYFQVAYLVGGIVAWEQNGLPLSKDLDYELNGGCACRLKPKKLP